MKTGLFQSCGHCCFPNMLAYWVQFTFTASAFRIWNSSTGIPSPPLALFLVMLPKVHLTSHSRMSGSRWVITPSWLSGSWRSFLYSSSVYSCHLFLISSASVRSIQFQSFIVPIFAWNVPLVSLIFLKRSLIFPILLFSSISLHWPLKFFHGAARKTQVRSLGREDLLEKGMATHFSILAWNNSIARGSWRVGYNLWGHKVLDTTEWLTLSFLLSYTYINTYTCLCLHICASHIHVYVYIYVCNTYMCACVWTHAYVSKKSQLVRKASTRPP